MSYLLKTPTTKKTPQSLPIPGRGRDMARNNAGGYAFRADSFTRLERFILMGSEGGSYYVGESDLTAQNVDNVRACIETDGLRVVRMVVDISLAGRAPKQDPALYVLALAASYGGGDQARAEEIRQAALDALPKVARIGTHLFQFCAFVDTLRGWGPALRRAVARWYTEKPALKLGYQLVKYQQRNGWSHSDLLRLAHPKPEGEANAALLRYVRKGAAGSDPMMLPPIINGFEAAKGADAKEVSRLIREHGLTHEMIPTEVQKSPEVWEALMEDMPMGAMIRNLGRMGACGLLSPLSESSKRVVEKLKDREALRAQRVHPIKVLAALLTYKTGHGSKGKLSWTPVPQVVDALNDAFYDAFEQVEPTGKSFYLGVDVSGSMGGGVVAGLDGLTPCMGAAVMAMLIARTEQNYFIGGFTSSFVDLGITRSDRLEAAMSKAQKNNFGGTDCAVAIKHALARKFPVDAFVVITDGETWAGDQHASQAIQDYRQKMGRDAKLIVMNMVANRTSLVDPTDPGSMDVVGFDASVPVVIAGFISSAPKPDVPKAA